MEDKLEAWEEKSKDLMGGFLRLFGRDGRIVRGGQGKGGGRGEGKRGQGRGGEGRPGGGRGDEMRRDGRIVRGGQGKGGGRGGETRLCPHCFSLIFLRTSSSMTRKRRSSGCSPRWATPTGDWNQDSKTRGHPHLVPGPPHDHPHTHHAELHNLKINFFFSLRNAPNTPTPPRPLFSMSE